MNSNCDTPSNRTPYMLELMRYSTVHDPKVWANEKTTTASEYLFTVNVRPSFVKMVNYFQETNKYSIEFFLCDMVYRHNHRTTKQKLLTANNSFTDTFPSLA